MQSNLFSQRSSFSLTAANAIVIFKGVVETFDLANFRAITWMIKRSLEGHKFRYEERNFNDDQMLVVLLLGS